LPALQPDGQDEGDHAGRGRDQPALGCDRSQRLREGHVFRAGGGRHSRPAEARGNGAREHRAHREVHAELLLRAGGTARSAETRRCGQRRLPLRAGSGPGARIDQVPRLPQEPGELGSAQPRAGADLFALAVYAQLILENARTYGVDPALVDQIFEVLVRDFSRHAVELHGRRASNEQQMAFALRMIRKPIEDAARYDRVWNEMVLPRRATYAMNR